MRRRGENDEYWRLNFGKRMEEELYDISKDMNCLNNRAFNPEFVQIANNLREQMEEELREQEDPSVFK